MKQLMNNAMQGIPSGLRMYLPMAVQAFEKAALAEAARLREATRNVRELSTEELERRLAIILERESKSENVRVQMRIDRRQLHSAEDAYHALRWSTNASNFIGSSTYVPSKLWILSVQWRLQVAHPQLAYRRDPG
jgi:hypothetical protein